MKRLFATALLLALMGIVCAGTAPATELVYQPVNPAFGGNPLNGAWLLNNATAQDNNKDPGITDKSNLDEFSETLQRRILSAISQRVVQSILGDDSLSTGSYTVGDFYINVTDTGDGGLTIDITDSNTGDSTRVEVPGY